jgi:hypothetical protein
VEKTSLDMRCLLRAFAFYLPLCISAAIAHLYAQSGAVRDADRTDRVRGVVVNSVTREPLSRALVSSPDNAFATMTDDRGRFEFIFPHAAIETSTTSPDPSQQQPQYSIPNHNRNRPTTLIVRKVGFFSPPEGVDISQIDPAQPDVRIELVPEARIAGSVIIPGLDGSDKLQLQLYRREITDGEEKWQPAGDAATRADGEFRFAELFPGYYKLLTQELPDRDPLTSDPRGQAFGYPPLYYPNASDFVSAAVIRLKAGEIFQPTMSPVKTEYYPVSIGFTNSPATSNIGIQVWPQAHAGPGYALGYNRRDGLIQGALPNGTYTVRVTEYAPGVMTGTVNITVRGAPVSGPPVTLLPGSAITVNVQEEFQHAQAVQEPGNGVNITYSSNAPSAGKRPNYLQVFLQPEEQFESNSAASLRQPTGPDDESLVIENVQPGRYRVIATPSIGYVSSITFGRLDLLRHSLVVGTGAAVPTVEITMRDDGAEIDGTVDFRDATQSGAGGLLRPGRLPGVAYFKSTEASYDRPKTVWINPDGTFTLQQLPPGTYRAFAVNRPSAEWEFPSEELLSQYGSKIQVVRAIAEQKQQVRLPLITVTE